MISKSGLDKIKKIIEKNYHSLLLKVAGPERRLLDLIYHHNYLNSPEAANAPTTIEGMQAQQRTLPANALQDAATDHLNATMVSLIEKAKAAAQASVEGAVREYNLEVRNKLIQGLKEPPESVSKLKSRLKDIAKEEGRSFKRVAVTETANAIGLGSADRVVAQNKGANFEEVYVFRLVTPDSFTCRWCRRFYLDDDGTPAVYRLSTLLSNGSNYGKKPDAWTAVVGATHPNERCSGLIQLRRGWKVQPGGKLDFVGFEGWEAYLKAKLRG